MTYQTTLSQILVFVATLCGCAALASPFHNVPDTEITALRKSLTVHAKISHEGMKDHLRQELAKPVWREFLGREGRVEITKSGDNGNEPFYSGGLALATALCFGGKYLGSALMDTAALPDSLSYVPPSLVTLLAISLGRDVFKKVFPSNMAYGVHIVGNDGQTLIILGFSTRDPT